MFDGVLECLHCYANLLILHSLEGGNQFPWVTWRNNALEIEIVVLLTACCCKVYLACTSSRKKNFFSKKKKKAHGKIDWLWIFALKKMHAKVVGNIVKHRHGYFFFKAILLPVWIYSIWMKLICCAYPIIQVRIFVFCSLFSIKISKN